MSAHLIGVLLGAGASLIYLLNSSRETCLKQEQEQEMGLVEKSNYYSFDQCGSFFNALKAGACTIELFMAVIYGFL